MAYLTLQLLGGISARLETIGRVRLPGKKSAALLAYLASDPGSRRSREELSALLWGNSDSAHAFGSLRQTLKLLRRCIHQGNRQVIRSDGDCIFIDPDTVDTDTLALDRLYCATTSKGLEQAAAIYQGEFLAGFTLDEQPFEEWLRSTRRQYHDRAIAVLGRLQDRYRSQGRLDEALGVGDELLRIEPAQEDVHRKQIELYLDLGRRHRALRQYRICCEILRGELDLVPEEETERLYARIRQTGSRGRGSPRKGAPAPGSRLPASGTTETGAPAGLLETFEDLPQPELPSLAVLPFRNLARDGAEGYYCQGLRYDIQTALIKVSGVLLIAPGSLKSLGNTSENAKRAAHDLGAHFMLEGSVRRRDRELDATFQLTNTGRCQIVWARRFNVAEDRVGDMHNEVVLGVLESLHIDVQAGEEARIFEHTLCEPEARNLFYQGTSLGYSMTREGNAAARSVFRKVARLQPDSPVGPTYLSFAYWIDVFKGWTGTPDRDLAKAVWWAKRALQLSDSNGLAYIVLAYNHLEKGHHREALASAFKAVEFRPNCPTANGFLAYVLVHAGRPTEAVQWIGQAIRRSPHYPPWFVNVLAASYRDTGDYDASIKFAKMALSISPADIEARVILCSDYVLAGEMERAIQVGQEIVEIRPSFSCRNYVRRKNYRHQDAGKLIEDALRKARLPE